MQGEASAWDPVMHPDHSVQGTKAPHLPLEQPHDQECGDGEAQVHCTCYREQDDGPQILAWDSGVTLTVIGRQQQGNSSEIG